MRSLINMIVVGVAILIIGIDTGNAYPFSQQSDYSWYEKPWLHRRSLSQPPIMSWKPAEVKKMSNPDPGLEDLLRLSGGHSSELLQTLKKNGLSMAEANQLAQMDNALPVRFLRVYK